MPNVLNQRNKLKVNHPNLRLVTGCFPTSTVNVNATLAVVLTAGSTVTLTSDTAGVAGNSLYARALADGSAQAAIDMSVAGCGQLDSVIEYNTGGTGGNAWTVDTIAHGITGGGVSIIEDTTNHVLTILFEDAVSTVANVETAIGLSTNFAVRTGGTGASVLAVGTDSIRGGAFSGGTAATYVEWAATNPHLTIHFTDGVSTVTAVNAAINATATNESMTASGGTGTDTWATADAFLATALSGGVSAVSLSTSSIRPLITSKGVGFTPSRTGGSGVGSYTVTMDSKFSALICGGAVMRSASSTAHSAQLVSYTAATGALLIRMVDGSGASDLTAASGNEVHFWALFKV